MPLRSPPFPSTPTLYPPPARPLNPYPSLYTVSDAIGNGTGVHNLFSWRPYAEPQILASQPEAYLQDGENFKQTNKQTNKNKQTNQPTNQQTNKTPVLLFSTTQTTTTSPQPPTNFQLHENNMHLVIEGEYIPS
jgi:hypothetical protein